MESRATVVLPSPSLFYPNGRTAYAERQHMELHVSPTPELLTLETGPESPGSQDDSAFSFQRVTMLVLAGIVVLHITTIILLLVATIDN
ncbi:hypothetical protein AMECASPLE_027020, partial [Ameca splendens]